MIAVKANSWLEESVAWPALARFKRLDACRLQRTDLSQDSIIYDMVMWHSARVMQDSVSRRRDLE